MNNGRFTTLELSTIELIIAGSQNRRIAELHGTTEGVIKNRLRVIFDKAGAETRLQLAMLAIEHGWTHYKVEKAESVVA